MVNREKNSIAQWTIMVYIAADDVLSDFAVGSLRQLRRVASEDADVVVAAQFDANGKQNISRLIFEGIEDSSLSIQDHKQDEIAADTDMADPAALRDFINWAYEQRKANYYCLVLWGHGPELLTDDYSVLPDGKKAKRFLTPSDVNQALANTKLTREGHKFEIMAIDACNMNMIELACEIPSYAEFLVASQEEVPDFSFPYDKLLALGTTNNREKIVRACREMPDRYINAYRDYFITGSKQTESITLSSLSLKNAGTVTDLLGWLADAFLKASEDDKKRQAIIDARANSKEFVVGLYIDLYDFCERLSSELFSKNVADKKLRSACEQICDAIRSRGEDAFVIANKVSQDQRCHGISIYFPYLGVSAKNTTEKPVVRGGMNLLDRNETDARGRGGTGKPNQSALTALSRGGIDALNKGGIDALNKGGIDALNKMRRQRIEETERYYAGLEFSKRTRWDEFIRHGWSRWLAEEAEAKVKSFPETDMSEVLNQQYSAQQCALNLLSFCRELEEGRKPREYLGS